MTDRHDAVKFHVVFTPRRQMLFRAFKPPMSRAEARADRTNPSMAHASNSPANRELMREMTSLSATIFGSRRAARDPAPVIGLSAWSPVRGISAVP